MLQVRFGQGTLWMHWVKRKIKTYFSFQGRCFLGGKAVISRWENIQYLEYRFLYREIKSYLREQYIGNKLNIFKKTPESKKKISLWWLTNSSSLFHYTFSCGEKASNSHSRAVNEEVQANDHRLSPMQRISIWKQVIKPREIIIDLKTKITFSFLLY